MSRGSGSLVKVWERGVELPDEDGDCKTVNGLLKISLADSDGVIVALVITDLVSSPYSATSSAVSEKDAEYAWDFGGGCDPRFSFCPRQSATQKGKTDPGAIYNLQSPLLSSHSNSYVKARICTSAGLKTA